jgi:hypothetical protein
VKIQLDLFDAAEQYLPPAIVAFRAATATRNRYPA